MDHRHVLCCHEPVARSGCPFSSPLRLSLAPAWIARSSFEVPLTAPAILCFFGLDFSAHRNGNVVRIVSRQHHWRYQKVDWEFS